MTREEAKKIIHRHVMLFSSMPDDVLEAIQTLEQESCGDAISRQEVLDELNKWEWQELYLPIHFKENIIDVVPSVNPQEPKTGHWKRTSIDLYVQHATAYYQCSECGEKVIGEHNYCQFCGAKMESEESDADSD